MSYSKRNIYFLTSKCGSVNCGKFLCVFIICFCFFTVYTNVWLCLRNY